MLLAVSVSESQLFFKVPPSFLFLIINIIYIFNNQLVTMIKRVGFDKGSTLF